MRKPINKWAIVIWVAAAIVVVTQLIDIGNLRSPEDNGTWSVVWGYIRTGTFIAAQLAALGALIELVDQIRWNLLPPEERATAKRRRSSA